MKRLIFIMILLFSFTISAKACSNEEKQLVYNQLNKIVVGYVPIQEFCLDDEDICTMLFKVEIQGMSNLLYAKYESGQDVIKDGVQSKAFYHSGIPYTFDIYAEDSACFPAKIATRNLTIPYYNFWSLEEECEVDNDFEYCKTYLNKPLDITKDTFKKEYQNYIEEQNKNKNVDDNIVKWQENIKNFLFNYYIYILIFIILSGGAGIFFLIRRERKERLI